MSFRYIMMVGAAALALSACSKNESSSDANRTRAAAERADSASTNSHDGPRQVTPPAKVDKDDKQSAKEATTILESLGDSGVKGTVTFTQKERANDDGSKEKDLLVTYNITGLTPGETRGFHIHEHGDCSSDDGSSAGGHFNPHNHEHGNLDSDDTHAGDLGNITADDEGNAHGKIKNVTKISLDKNDDTYIVGRSIIVHEKEDDLKSQPTGDAGGRVACGVIELKPEHP